MKNSLLLLSIVLLSQFSFSQSYNGERADEFVSGADEVWFRDNRKIPAYIHFRDDVSLSVQQALDMVKKLTESDRIDFVLTDTQRNRNGEVTYRYAQLLDGLRVEFMVLHVHVRNDRVFAVNGDIRTDERRRSSFRFAISESDGLERALEYHGADVYMWQDSREESLLREMTMKSSASYFPKGERVLVPVDLNDPDSELKAVYKFDIFSKVPYDRKHIYIDAVQGDVVLDVARIYRADDRVGTAHTQYNGIREINTEYIQGVYILKDNTRGKGIRTLNCNNYSYYDNYSEFIDDDNVWNNINTKLDQYATDAHFAAISTYDYYLQVHGRNSIDGQGHPLYSFIHYDYNYANAFWNGEWMTYGDGNSEYGQTPFVSVDICAHEITHGLTNYTANLIYQYESGALNEAFSDIFGTAVEFFATPEKADWTMGEDIGGSMRSMENPKLHKNPNTYLGEYWVTGSEDNGGVHHNSGVLNYWFYLVSMGGSGINDLGNSYEVKGIGIEKAERIAFRTLTVYLTPYSGYEDAAYYSMRSAIDLYGGCSPEAQTVGDAFFAVGVSDAYTGTVEAEFSAKLTSSCSPPFTVQFQNKDYNGEEYLWDFGDGTTSTEQNPSHTYTDFGKYTVSLAVSSTSCGSDKKIKENYITIDATLPCHYSIPVSGNLLIEKYSGTIYAPGGPNDKYPDNCSGSITIHAKGAERIVLNIKEFDIEPITYGNVCTDYVVFHDGKSTSSAVINNMVYCNSRGNPVEIFSSGEYITIYFSSDESETTEGFKIDFHTIGADQPPYPRFTSDKQYSCDGLVKFTDISLNSCSSWEWDFGDGTTSTEQNPIHPYAASGNYSVNLSVTNQYGNATSLKESYITVEIPEILATDNFTACSDMDFNLYLDLQGEAYWYENRDATTPVHIGNTWTHPPISENKSYYVKEKREENIMHVGSPYITNGGYYDYYYLDYLTFDAYTPFTLKSVLVNAEERGNRVIELRDNKFNTISQKTVLIPQGVSRIQLDMEIPKGENLQLALSGGRMGLFKTFDPAYTQYPYEIENLVKIKYAREYITYYYPYFYNWEIITGLCESELTRVDLIPVICTGIENEKPADDIYITPTPEKGLFHIYGLNLAESYLITVNDISGKTVMNKYITPDNNIIDLRRYAEGIYLIAISDLDRHRIFKLINRK